MNLPRKVQISQQDAGHGISFNAMASPCDVLIDSKDKQLVQEIGHTIANEAWRIEDKYSRYLPSSVCSAINSNQGKTLPIDLETFQLLEFANHCYQLSDGLFDITSGVLRKVWRFDTSDNVPAKGRVKALVKKIGWQKVKYQQTSICLPKGMEIDFGGLGKEYAVDKAILLAKRLCDAPVLINFGGDLACTGPRRDGSAWQVGIEHPGLNSADRDCTGLESSCFESTGRKNALNPHNETVVVSMSGGALATSGDAKRFLLKNGVRYSHILNVKNGWPVQSAPKSMTVAAPQCIQAGFLATLAMLQGKQAEVFLDEQEIKYWSIR